MASPLVKIGNFDILRYEVNLNLIMKLQLRSFPGKVG